MRPYVIISLKWEGQYMKNLLKIPFIVFLQELLKLRASFILILLIQSSEGAELGPSFDCRKAQGKIEKSLCETPSLATLDREISNLYQSLLKSQSNLATEVKDSQKKWISIRNNCVKQTNSNLCLARVMSERKENLNKTLKQDLSNPSPIQETNITKIFQKSESWQLQKLQQLKNLSSEFLADIYEGDINADGNKDMVVYLDFGDITAMSDGSEGSFVSENDDQGPSEVKRKKYGADVTKKVIALLLKEGTVFKVAAVNISSRQVADSLFRESFASIKIKNGIIEISFSYGKVDSHRCSDNGEQNTSFVQFDSAKNSFFVTKTSYIRPCDGPDDSEDTPILAVIKPLMSKVSFENFNLWLPKH